MHKPVSTSFRYTFWLFLGLLFLSSFPSCSHAQRGKEQAIKSQEALKQFEYLIGNWEGDAEVFMRDQKLQIFQTEQVAYKLDGTILVVEGTGYSTSAKEEIVFQAFAVISYLPKTEKYVVRAYKDGNQLDSDVEITGESSFLWQFTQPFGTTRNSSTITQNTWEETGEFSRDGETFFPTYQAKLKRVE